LSDWAEIFFVDTYDYISEVVLGFFENLTFIIFNKKIRKSSLENQCPGFQKPISRDRKVRIENGHLCLWRILGNICGKNFSPIGAN
jgi:hypothetical protein